MSQVRTSTKTPTAQKSLALSYFLWALGGPWGLHHIYLGRYRQAFLWITTLGGFIGIGWVRDIWRMPAYVSEANKGSDYMEEMVRLTKFHQKPPVSIPRVFAEILFGSLIGVTVIAGLPQDIVTGDLGKSIMMILIPLCTGLAVHLVANIGHEKTSMKWSLLGSYAAVLLFAIDIDNPMSNITKSALASTVAANWKGKSWRRMRYKRSTNLLLFVLFAAYVLYLALWTSAILHNAYITTDDGEKVRLIDSFGNIRESEAWQHPINTAFMLWSTFDIGGFENMWSHFIQAIDPEGERNAYQVLGVRAGASEKELRAAYRNLVKLYHPDKESDPTKKLEKQEKFIAIQKAFDTVSTINSRRSQANRKDRSDYSS